MAFRQFFGPIWSVGAFVAFRAGLFLDVRGLSECPGAKSGRNYRLKKTVFNVLMPMTESESRKKRFYNYPYMRR